MGTVTLVVTVPVAGIEAEPNLGKLQRFFGRHLGFLTFLVPFVVYALGVYPRAELARVLGHDGVSELGLVLPEV